MDKVSLYMDTTNIVEVEQGASYFGEIDAPVARIGLWPIAQQRSRIGACGNRRSPKKRSRIGACGNRRSPKKRRLGQKGGD